MVSGPDALLVFYGLFWAAALLGVGRYRLFDAHAMLERSPEGGMRLLRRMAVGVTVMNLLPLLWLAYVLVPIVQPLTGAGALLWASVLALSAFGWQRLLHGIVSRPSVRSCLYRDSEWAIVECRMKREGVPLGRSGGHLTEGLLYLVVPLAATLVRAGSGIGWLGLFATAALTVMVANEAVRTR